MGRIANSIIADRNQAIIFLNIVLSIAAVLITYQLGRLMFNKTTAFIAGLVMVFNPLFWFYGEVATIYAAEAFGASLAVLGCWLALSKDGRYIYLSGFVLGLLGGIRTNLVVFLFPLWLFAIRTGSRRFHRIVLALTILLIGVVLWYVPTVILSGGLERYQAVSAGLSGDATDKIMIWFGSYPRYMLVNSLNFLVWNTYLLGPLGLTLLPAMIVRHVRSSSLREALRNPKTVFFALWFLPSALFYEVIFIDKPGYLLTYGSMVYLLIAWSITRLFSNRGQIRPYGLVISANIAICILWFVIPAKMDGTYNRISFPSKVLPQSPVSQHAWDISYREITFMNVAVSDIQTVLYQPGDSYPFTPQNTLLVYRGHPLTWRHLEYHAPDYLSVWLIDTEVSGQRAFGAEAYFAQNELVWSTSGLPMWYPGEHPDEITISISPHVRYILWFIPTDSLLYSELVDRGRNNETIKLEAGQLPVLVTELGEGETLSIGAFDFVPRQ